ncbi:MAG: septum formation protein Maf [Ruminococcus sp.]|nr:septum formation protein Maf [Ruminococcus sp.]
MKIILASASPRRKELLKLIYDDFEIRPSDADEALPSDLAVDKAAEFLACLKAESVEKGSDELIIGCDTVVVTDNKILGKPKDRSDCFDMLKMLSGRRHCVYTGVCIRYNNAVISFTEKTEVEFHELSDDEIAGYMDTGEPFDKAGGYGIQGKGALLVRGICGDYFNVVGLPVSALARKIDEMLKK